MKSVQNLHTLALLSKKLRYTDNTSGSKIRRGVTGQAAARSPRPLRAPGREPTGIPAEAKAPKSVTFLLTRALKLSANSSRIRSLPLGAIAPKVSISSVLIINDLEPLQEIISVQ